MMGDMMKHGKRPVRIEGNVVFIILTKGYEAMVDVIDADLVSAHNWYAVIAMRRNGEVRTVYAARTEWIGGKSRIVYLHRVIAGALAHLDVDHIDGNGLNNRRANLRAATRSENLRNSGASCNSKSGIKGVSWSRVSQKWVAQITINRKVNYLGLFTEMQDAAAAYAKASAEIHGEFGRVA